MIKIAINGFGRIGRNAFKIAFESEDVEVVAINDLTDNKTLAHLLKFDTAYGRYGRDIDFDNDNLIIGGKKIKSFSEKYPANLPWKELEVDVVLECTGVFLTEEKAQAHITAGAKKVVMSAPAKDKTPTFVLGVNAEDYKGQKIINNASCTTNCITPVVDIINKNFKIKKAMMTTIHSYTADQNLQDSPHKDLRRARAAGANIVPTSTGAAKATTEAIPSLKDKFDGLAVRVPTIVVSLSDITFLVEKKTTVEEVNEALKKASETPALKGILGATQDELVSSDFIGNPFSSIVDFKLTQVVDGDLVKVIAWYDNEWGYSNRLVEQAITISKVE